MLRVNHSVRLFYFQVEFLKIIKLENIEQSKIFLYTKVNKKVNKCKKVKGAKNILKFR